MKNAPDGGVFYFSRITFLQPPQGRGSTPARRGIIAGPAASQPPCRGRRPRRPAVTVFANSTAFRRPPPGRGITADPVSPHQPCRGRRPRRPFPSFTAGPTAPQGLRAAGAARKGGTPGEGPPFNPLLRFVKHKESSARCGARPGAPPLDPARFFVKKRGKKLLNASLHPTQTPRRGGE